MANVIEFTIRGVDNFSNVTSKFTRGVVSAGRSVVKFGAIISGITAAAALPVLKVAKEFEKLEASLKTVTGSAENAANAMAGIQKFAKETPFQVSEIADAFIKLTALGLEPSEEALRSYGNTASAMGKSLDQFIEAVADATTNEFERLKEFGIKSKQEGDKVSFTFQGVTTTVKKSSEDITGYLQGIGNTQFAGAMTDQMNTLDGRLSNLGDSFDIFFVNLGKLGLLDLAKDAVSGLIEVVEGLTPVAIKAAAVTTIAFETIKKKLQDSFDSGTLFEDFLSNFTNVASALIDQAGTLAFAVLKTMVSSWDVIFRTFFILGKNAFNRTYDLLVNSTEAVILSVGAAFTLLWDGVTESASFAWNNIKAIFNDDEFRSISDLLFQDIPEKTAETRENLAKIFDGIEFTTPGLTDTFNEIAASTKETRDKVAENLSSVVSIYVDNLKTNASAIAEFMGITEEEVATRVASMSALIEGVQGSLAANSAASAEVVLGVWDEVFERFKTLSEEQTTFALETSEILFTGIQSLVEQTSNAIADTLVDGKNLAEGMKNVFKSVAKSIIASLIQMGVQRLVTSKLFAVANAKEVISRSAPMPPLAAAGAFTSMVAAPFPLNTTAPAFASAAFGTVAGFAQTAATLAAGGQFHDGGVVPRDGSFTLQRGEVVVPNNPGQDVVEALDRFGGGGGGGINIGSIHILENATSFDALMQISDDDMKNLVEEKIIDALSALDDEGIRPRNQERSI